MKHLKARTHEQEGEAGQLQQLQVEIKQRKDDKHRRKFRAFSARLVKKKYKTSK